MSDQEDVIRTALKMARELEMLLTKAGAEEPTNTESVPQNKRNKFQIGEYVSTSADDANGSPALSLAKITGVSRSPNEVVYELCPFGIDDSEWDGWWYQERGLRPSNSPITQYEDDQREIEKLKEKIYELQNEKDELRIEIQDLEGRLTEKNHFGHTAEKPSRKRAAANKTTISRQRARKPTAKKNR